jgi:hypothetical protein
VEASQKIRVIAPKDWTNVPFKQLLDRVSQRSGPEVPSKNSSIDYSHTFLEDGQPIARLGIPAERSASTAIVVGGLATGAGIPGFPGVIVGHSPDLARASATAVALDFDELLSLA